MKESKIKDIKSVSSRVGKYGQMYTYVLAMENGEEIKLNKTKENAFKVGDLVKYESNGEGKWKEAKENNGGGYSQSSKKADSNRGAMLGLAVKIAFDKEYKSEDDYQKTMYLVNRIFEDTMEIYEGKGVSQKKEEMAQSSAEVLKEKATKDDGEDLPF